MGFLPGQKRIKELVWWAISGLSGRPWGNGHILNDSFLEDLNSTNVNGKLIKKHALQYGDVITIGHHQLCFADQHAKDIEQDEFEKTMVIPSGQQNAAQLAEADAAVAAAESAANAATREGFDVRVDILEKTKKLDTERVLEHRPTPRPEPVSHTASSRNWNRSRFGAESIAICQATGLELHLCRSRTGIHQSVDDPWPSR